MPNPPLTTDQANAIYNVLVTHAGVSEQQRDNFVAVQTDRPCTEYRFQGDLGFGGKFWNDGRRWYVAAAPEDVQARPSRNDIVNYTNAQLAGLLAAENALAGMKES